MDKITKKHVKKGIVIMRNIIPEFTKEEIDAIHQKCNLTPREKKLMELRNEEITLEQCAELMNCSDSTIKRINKKLMGKIMKQI